MIDTVPALLVLACTLVALIPILGYAASNIREWTGVRLIPHTRVEFKELVAGLAITCAVGVLTCIIWAVSLRQEHWNDTCHQAGGVLLGTESCIKPGSEITIK